MTYMLIEVSDREIGIPEFFDSNYKAFNEMVDRVLECDHSLNKETVVECVTNYGGFSEDDVCINADTAWITRNGVYCDWHIFEVGPCVSNMSVHDLSSELQSREDVVAVQIWQKDDVISAFQETCGYEPSTDIVNRIAHQAQGALEDCQYGWESLYAVVDDVIGSM